VRQIDYTKNLKYGQGITLYATKCPYKIGTSVIMVKSAKCTKCICYIGKIKNKNSILCEGDEILYEEIKKKITYKTLLTETVFENK
jgi:hypothetical protein